MENIPTFCNVKNGLEARRGIHPLIDPLLDETQGIIVYQEQVMEIARKMAGYSLGGADMLRRAMGKKIQEAMDAERPKFIEGAKAQGVTQEKAVEVWNLLDKFANYGFNKSHAAAYAVVSYQTAWLKANHPVELMAAVMNLDIHNTDKLNQFMQECRRLKVPIEVPDVNRSRARFTVEDGRILYALGALKNVGLDAMRLITGAREDGPFTDLFDFARRVDLKAIGKRALEMLARAGAFGSIEANRARVWRNLDKLVDYSAAIHAERASGQVGLFGAAGEALPPPRLAGGEDWAPTARLAEEHAAVGFYLSGHPLDDYAAALARKRVLTHAEFQETHGQTGGRARIAGTLSQVQNRKSAKGTRFAFLSLSDTTGGYEVMAFADVLAESEDLLQTGANLVLTVEAEAGAESGRLMLRAVQAADQVVADAAASGLRVTITEQSAVASVQARLAAGMAHARGRGTGPVHFVIPLPDREEEVEVALPGLYRLGPDMRGALKAAPGVAHVEEF